MRTLHAYLFGGPADGTVVTVPPCALSFDLAGSGTAAELVRRHTYEATGDAWHNRVFGPMTAFVYRGSEAR